MTWNNKKIILLLLAADLLAMSLIFSVTGIFNTDVDTAIYVSQIKQFDQNLFDLSDVKACLRFFKPLYGIIGSWLAPVLTPYASILSLNILFFFSLSVAVFFLFLELGIEKKFSAAGAVWVSTGYPLLKYGLALGTDISGWFFAVSTALAVLVGARTGKAKYFVLASLIGFIGALAKESGVLGLVFGGVYILAHIGAWNFKKIINRLACLSLPFFALEGLFLFLMHRLGFPSFLDWYALNLSHYAGKYYKLFYFIGTELSSFNIILLFAAAGIYYAVKKKDILDREWLARFGGLFVASLPVLAWPIFISRVLYVQFLFFIPMALYGICNFSLSSLDRKIFRFRLSDIMLFAPVAASLALFLLSGKESLFDVLKNFLP